MTISEIANNIKVQAGDWGREKEQSLIDVLNEQNVKDTIGVFIEKSVDFVKGIYDPNTRVATALKLSGVACFKLGLTVGLLMDRPEITEDPRTEDDPRQQVLMPIDYSNESEVPCSPCLQTGEVCERCTLSRWDCVCQTGSYTPVRCQQCGGKGTVAK